MPQGAPDEQIAKGYRKNILKIVDACEMHDVPLLLGTVPINLRYTNAPGIPHYEIAPEELWGECVLRGAAIYDQGLPREALEHLRSCDDETEGIAWIGAALYDLGEYEKAGPILSQAAELYPLNRTRPSFNDIVREIASEHDSVTLVDLEAAINAAAPHGLPGRELFVDHCHLNWKGYEVAARSILDALYQNNLVPGYDPSRTVRSAEDIASDVGGLDPTTPWISSPLR